MNIEKEKIGNVKLNYEYYSGSDLYSDGEVEDELLDIVEHFPLIKYDDIIAEKKTWPILYHLSHLRENIVEWIPISKNDRVLEIGSGCGAITGVLAKKALKVDCIELSEKRSLINATRNKEYDNIEIIIGNFETIEPSLIETYDYITLIGVLEYGGKYINAERPFEEFLKIIKKHLTSNGKVIIAIENKLGMKYWAGCREDHLGKYFAGIEGYEKTNGIKTFSKNEIKALLSDAGYKEIQFYYPYPDYKLPEVIYSDEYLPKVGELTNNIVNYDYERLVLFDETKAFNSIIVEGVFPEFSNSFLIISK